MINIKLDLTPIFEKAIENMPPKYVFMFSVCLIGATVGFEVYKLNFNYNKNLTLECAD